MKIQNQIFDSEEIHLDFHHFVGCEFKRCKLIFHGFQPPRLENCKFEEINWHFSSAAGQTLNFIAALYHGGAKDLIERTFENIRTGRPPQAPLH